MQQPHTEQNIEHKDGQQDTGNHKKPGAPEADRLGGTRTGAENVEPARAGKQRPVRTAAIPGAANRPR